MISSEDPHFFTIVVGGSIQIEGAQLPKLPRSRIDAARNGPGRRASTDKPGLHRQLKAYYSVNVSDHGTIDSKDAEILSILQANARETQADIARSVGLAPSAVLERIRKLEAKGVIKGYAALLDPRALDQGLLAYVSVRGEEAPGDDSVARSLADCPEVLEVHHVAGEDCYLIKVRARDAEHLGQLLRTRLGRVPGVRSTCTTIVLETVKEDPRLLIASSAGSDS